MVGGPNRGTRFRPLSLYHPKPLFPVAGIPMLGHHLIALSKLESIEEILVIGFYEKEVFELYLEQVEDELKVPIRYLKEISPMGTAGGLLFFQDQILKNNPDYFFILNVDVCCSFPLSEMLDFHKNKQTAIGTILGTKVKRCLAK